MARTISDEELQLKRRARRRLIGAIVLVTIIVVVLPMVLDSEPRQARQEVSVRIPSPESGVFTSKVVPLPAPPDAKATSKAPESKAETQPPAEEKKLAAAPPPAAGTPPPAKEAAAPKSGPEKVQPAKAEPAAPPRPARKARPAAKPAKGRFVVQVIALADAEKAKGMQQQIAAAGVKSYTEVVKTAKGDVTRVRAGPFATRAAAEKAREQLKALGMNGNITTR